ncbi:MAG: cytochrome b/b6 domain-containing protein [Pseudorhodobacter sp.]|nr:cytochrome b/b6 domain-containing protein [Pseudorhodobacter sp.]
MAKSGYGKVQIGLHWAAAALIVGNYFISEGMGDALDARAAGTAFAGLTPTYHVWAGMTLLALVLLRLVIRLVQGTPEQIDKGLAGLAAATVHWLLYGLMIAVPCLGIAAWFFGIDAAGDLHVLAMNTMMVLMLGHAAVAIFHHFVLRDGLLSRMTPLR